MNSVKSVSDTFNSLSDSVKKYVPLYGDPRLDENKNYFKGDIILKVLKSSLDLYLIKNSLFKNYPPITETSNNLFFIICLKIIIT